MFDWFKEALSKEWWKDIWIPASSLGLVWLFNSYRTLRKDEEDRDAREEERHRLAIEDLEDRIRERDAAIEECEQRRRRDIKDLEARNLEAREEDRKEIHKLYYLARYWFDTAHNLNHKIASLKMNALAVFRQHGKEAPQTWNKVIILPDFEDPEKNKAKPSDLQEE